MLCSSTHYSSFPLFPNLLALHNIFTHMRLLWYYMTVEIGLLIKQVVSSSASIMPEISLFRRSLFSSSATLMTPFSTMCRSYYACLQINILITEYCSLAVGILESFGWFQFQIRRAAVISGGFSLFYSVCHAPTRIIPWFRPWLLHSHPFKFINLPFDTL
jgi:hypothetical protein